MISKYVSKTPYEVWTQKKPILHHFHVWDYKVEMRSYNPQSKKLDLKTISGYFISYCVGSKCLRFYCTSHTTRVIESNRAIYFEDNTSTSQGLREIVFKEHPIFIHVPNASTPIFSLVFYQHPIVTTDDKQIEDVDLVALDIVMDIPLKRLERVCRPEISDDYIVYL